MRQRPQQLFPPALIEAAELARKLFERLPALCICLCRHDIGDSFRLCQVQFAVLKRAAGEFAGLCQSHSGLPPHHGVNGGDDRRTSMKVQLGHRLSRIAMGRRKERDKAVVYQFLALRIAKPHAGQATSWHWAYPDCPERLRCTWAGDPDLRDPGAARRGGAGKNRVGGRRLDQRMGSQIDAQETG